MTTIHHKNISLQIEKKIYEYYLILVKTCTIDSFIFTFSIAQKHIYISTVKVSKH